MSGVMSSEELFPEICSEDFLRFSFGGRSYEDQLNDGIAKTGQLSAVRVEVLEADCSQGRAKIVWVSHNFGFLGGSLGCAEGEKITRAFEYALEHRLAVCVQCRSGGARMQEGTSSLMQMAKVSVAVEALQRARLPFIAVLNDPTYGGVSASYAMQADVKIAVSDARIGFAGPQVILNTMCEANQKLYDSTCPADFQSSSYVLEHGQLDCLVDAGEGLQGRLVETVAGVVHLIAPADSNCRLSAEDARVSVPPTSAPAFAADIDADKAQPLNYTNSRRIDRPQTQDIITNLFEHFVELSGDGRMGRDCCIRGGLCAFETSSGPQGCVVIATAKGHTPQAMQEANYGMASPHGYRTALRLMKLAERFGLPVVTLVDTVGAWPTFECERDGQSEAIATNLTAMAGLTVPIITILAGEGGSGGALGIGMGNVVGMLSGGYFGVISPEGAASILGRYKDDADKAARFPADCQELAKAQCIYADQLQAIGVVDEIIWESTSTGNNETYLEFPVLKSRVSSFLQKTLQMLLGMSGAELVEHRYRKYRAMGKFAVISSVDERQAIVKTAKDRLAASGTANKKIFREKNGIPEGPLKQLLHFIAEETVSGNSSRYRAATAAAIKCPEVAPDCPSATVLSTGPNAKSVLDSEGPEELARWVRQQKKVLLTDTTMRDAHQSLLATRVRTEDLVKGARHANDALRTAFSFECWGGATFDVAMRFLDECPWDRLREIRQAAPDVCLQMLIRGSNAVGYTSYADNVVAEFIRLAAENGMDVFRIFDCFNDVDSMAASIQAVRNAGKVAEVCLCYAGNVLTSSVYNLAYYENLTKLIVAAGAHFIGIKDMAGLLRPREAGPLLNVIRSITDLPVHFHTHATSSGSLATCLEMARLGCDIVDTCTASMADGTSQPSMNAFLALTEGEEYHPGIPFLSLEPYDMYWGRVRAMYSEFESGMLSGTARVFEHQIPGGQYSNLIVQCQSMGLWDRWEEVLDAYRDVNDLFGDIVKVTPSSKCVGDLAIYLVTINMKAKDVLDPAKAAAIDFPESVIGLMRGDLGYPHRGFPEAVTSAVLKGAMGTKRTLRAGLTLPPVDFNAHRAALSEKWNMSISAEKAMSELMYPKVFSDFMARQTSKGGALIRHLPTPVYIHGMVPSGPPAVLVVPCDSGNLEKTEINMTRVCPLKDGKRVVCFLIDGSIVHEISVKDRSGKFIYEGPMATPGDLSMVGSPMPGVVEKLLVAAGDFVEVGDVLCTVSAMKMEVKVSSPIAGVIQAVGVGLGTRVVEGALMFNITRK